MNPSKFAVAFDLLEPRRLLAWSGYAQLVDQDVAASTYPGVTGAGVTVAVISLAMACQPRTSGSNDCMGLTRA